jgi:hypothetical protein
MVINKYLAGLLTVAVVFLTAFQAALADGLSVVEAWQLAGLFVGAFVTTFVPILEKGWAAMLKVAGAVLGAAITAIVPLVMSEWNASTITIVVLAVINALAVQLGVNVRVDSARSVIADPTKSMAAIEALDPKAVAAASNGARQKIA